MKKILLATAISLSTIHVWTQITNTFYGHKSDHSYGTGDYIAMAVPK